MVINDGNHDKVVGAMEMLLDVEAPTTLPQGSFVLVRTWYYALFAKSGRGADEWRKPGGFIFIPGLVGTPEPVAKCPKGIVEVLPIFDMTMRTLTVLINIRNHKKENPGFDTSRSLDACEKEVPKSRNYYRESTVTTPPPPPHSPPPPITDREGPRRSQRLKDSPETIPHIESSSSAKWEGGMNKRAEVVAVVTPPVRKRRKGLVADSLTGHHKRLYEFGMLCWNKYGQGKDVKKAQDYKTMVGLVNTLPPLDEQSAGREDDDDNNSGSSDMSISSLGGGLFSDDASQDEVSLRGASSPSPALATVVKRWCGKGGTVDDLARFITNYLDEQDNDGRNK